MFADSVRQGFQDHVVLADVGEHVDALVIGVALVVGREDALNFQFVPLLQNIQPNGSVEEKEGPVPNRRNHQRLHQSDMRNRRRNLSILP